PGDGRNGLRAFRQRHVGCRPRLRPGREHRATIRRGAAHSVLRRDDGRSRPRSYNSGMERKLATVMFVDLVGSTALVTSADPEVVRRRVNRFFGEVSSSVTAHGGVVEKFAGDAVLAAFGVPQAHEDDAERAIKASFMILDQVRELGLEARVGIESGEVVVEDADSTFVTGEAVNVAARLQQQAGPGEVLIGPIAHNPSVAAIEAGQPGPAGPESPASP